MLKRCKRQLRYIPPCTGIQRVGGVKNEVGMVIAAWTIAWSLSMAGSHGRLAPEPPPEWAHQVYASCGLAGTLSVEAFEAACSAYQQRRQHWSRDVLTIIDYSLPSTQKRLFVIDLARRVLLYQSHVAHGRNSGSVRAHSFSNRPGSLMSSLGAFRTAETYQGKHGYSLRLDGLEQGLNDQARDRTIVVHAAHYADPAHIGRCGRLGRSQGCPALPPALSNDIINAISGGSCLFVWGGTPPQTHSCNNPRPEPQAMRPNPSSCLGN